MSFEEFYKKLGFESYPFSVWSSEQEKVYRQDIFIRPNYYSPIEEKFKLGSGMFLIGERGSGKTASLYDLSVNTKADCLLVNVDDFSEIEIFFSVSEIYRLVTRKISDKLINKILLMPRIIRKLDHRERLFLCYLYSEFTTETTKAELENNLRIIQSSFWKRLAYFSYGIIKNPLNLFFTATQNAVSETIYSSLGFSGSSLNTTEIKKFFPDLPFQAETQFNEIKSAIAVLKRTASLCEKIGIARIVVLIDKLDEDSRLGGDAEKIAEFVRGILQETNLHLSDSIQMVTSIWTIPYEMIKNKYNIRSQKMNVDYINWDKNDLELALNRRLEYFSEKRIRDYRQIFASNLSESWFDKIFFLSNNNPRDLWHLFDKIIRKQYAIDKSSPVLSEGSIELGFVDFVKTFDYFEYYPRKEGARDNSMDVYSYIRHLLRVGSVQFTRNQLTAKSGVSGGSASNYVNGMEKIGLISTVGQEGGAILYNVRDPKIVYAIQKNIEILKAN